MIEPDNVILSKAQAICCFNFELNGVILLFIYSVEFSVWIINHKIGIVSTKLVPYVTTISGLFFI